MTKLNEKERIHLELAFESSRAIVNLAGLQVSDDRSDLEKRIIEGELTFDEAVLSVLMGCAGALPTKK